MLVLLEGSPISTEELWSSVRSMHSYFLVSPEMFDPVQVQALAEPLKDIQRLAPKSLLQCLGCVLKVIVLLEGEPSPSLRS